MSVCVGAVVFAVPPSACAAELCEPISEINAKTCDVVVNFCSPLHVALVPDGKSPT
jgi:hypothetical protein